MGIRIEREREGGERKRERKRERERERDRYLFCALGQVPSSAENRYIDVKYTV